MPLFLVTPCFVVAVSLAWSANFKKKQRPFRTFVFKYKWQQPSWRNLNSYWKHVEEACWLQVTADINFIYKRLYCFWSHVGKRRDDQGSLTYFQLFALVKCVLCLSHGNSTPERGFSINKQRLMDSPCIWKYWKLWGW